MNRLNSKIRLWSWRIVLSERLFPTSKAFDYAMNEQYGFVKIALAIRKGN